MMLAFAAATPGQVEFTAQGVQNWVVPDGVQNICMVAVQSGSVSAQATTVTVGGTVVCRAQNGARIGDGGGEGGIGGSGGYDGFSSNGGGGGGAGGYSGNGGRGGDGNDQNGWAQPATAGQGGGGSGGGGGYGSPYYQTTGKLGGGVGLKGQGASGAVPAFLQPGSPGSNGSGQQYGGGDYTVGPGVQGGALSYTNNVPVVPGQTVQINVGTSGGAVRILWGDGRFYPSTNTGDA